MAENPYASEGFLHESDPDPVLDEPIGPPRTSVTAILSLVCSIPCCVPGAPLLGMMLGVVSLRSIRRSNGRVGGRPAAIGGIIVGLMVTVLQVAIGIGATQVWTYWAKQMTPATTQFVQALEAGDVDAARAKLSSAGNQNLTDERLALFAGAMRDEFGAYQRAETDLGPALQVLGRTMRGSSGSAGSSATDDPTAPVVLIFDSGETTAWVTFDNTTLQGGPDGPKIVDLMMITAQGEAITLREDGPATLTALQLGMPVKPLGAGSGTETGDGPDGDGREDDRGDEDGEGDGDSG